MEQLIGRVEVDQAGPKGRSCLQNLAGGLGLGGGWGWLGWLGWLGGLGGGFSSGKIGWAL